MNFKLYSLVNPCMNTAYFHHIYFLPRFSSSWVAHLWPKSSLPPFLSKSIVENFLILTTFLIVGLTHQKSDTSVCTAVNLGMVVHLWNHSHTCVILAVKLTKLRSEYLGDYESRPFGAAIRMLPERMPSPPWCTEKRNRPATCRCLLCLRVWNGPLGSWLGKGLDFSICR